MMKRTLAAALCLMLMFALLPKTARAADNSVYINGVELSDGDYYINGGIEPVNTEPTVWNAHFDSGVLTLKGLIVTDSEKSVTVRGGDVYIYGIYYAPVDILDSLTIVLDGNSTVSTSNEKPNDNHCAVKIDCNLTIEGSGTLTAIAGRAAPASGGDKFSYGLLVNSITQTSGTIKATGGKADYSSSYGVYVPRTNNTYYSINISGGTIEGTGGTADRISIGVCVENGDLTASGGTITGTGGRGANDSYGVHANKITTTKSGSITGTGGDETITSCGVLASTSTIIVNGGTITGTGGEGTKFSYGVKAPDNITVSGGKIQGTGGTAGNSYGAYANMGSITANNGGSITGTGGGDGDTIESCGVYTNDGAITADGGSITGTGGEGTGNSYGVYLKGANTETRNITVKNNGTITGTGGTAKYKSYGVSCVTRNVTEKNSVIIETGGNIAGIGGTGNTSGTVPAADICSCGITAQAYRVSAGRMVGEANTNGYALPLSLATGSVTLPDPCYWRTGKSDGYSIGQPSLASFDAKTYADIRSDQPTIEITTQPAANTTVTEGSITGSLHAAASTLFGGNVTFNWYACSASGTPTGTSLGTGGTFAIPSTLTAGTHYYLCQATCPGAVTKNSSVATVMVATHGISVSPAVLSFGKRTEGYAQPAAQTVTVTYTGNTGSVTLAQPTSAQYNIGTLSRTTLDMTNKTATFTVQPKAGLAIGTYAAPISIVTTPAQASAVTVTPGFTVASIEDLQVSPSASFVQSKAPETKVTVGAGISGFGIGNFVSAEMGPQGGTLALLRDGTDYSKAQGSIIVTLHKSYLDTLVPGVYTLRIHLTNLPGQSYPPYVETTITVHGAAVPKTGDAATPMLWLGLMLLAGAGLAVSAVRRKRQNG